MSLLTQDSASASCFEEDESRIHPLWFFNRHLNHLIFLEIQAGLFASNFRPTFLLMSSHLNRGLPTTLLPRNFPSSTLFGTLELLVVTEYVWMEEIIRA